VAVDFLTQLSEVKKHKVATGDDKAGMAEGLFLDKEALAYLNKIKPDQVDAEERHFSCVWG